MSARQAKVLISGQLLANLLTKGTPWRGEALVIEGLPAGARYVRCFDEPTIAETAALVFEHESFAEVGPGDLIPTFPSVMVRVAKP